NAHGARATTVRPRTTPRAKVPATRACGAEIILHGDAYDDAKEEAPRIATERQLCVISAFDDPLIVAGQGTAGIEIAEDMPAVDVVIVPVGGGGLAAGIAVAIRALAPRAKIIGVQVEAAPGVKRSLEERRIVS